MDINTHTSLQIIHNYDENDYGYFCDPSKPGSPFIQNKFKVRSYSYPSDIKTINENYENYENYENNKMLESQVKKNTKKIESLNAITMIQNLKIEVAKLKNDMGKGIKNNSKSINDLKTTLEGYKKQLITSMTPTNSEETQNN